MILHTVNKSFLTNNCLKDCLSLCTDNASILLIEDGVYAAINTPPACELVDNNNHINFYVLKADLLARGLVNNLNPEITVVDDRGFVDLCAAHHTVQSWY